MTSKYILGQFSTETTQVKEYAISSIRHFVCVGLQNIIRIILRITLLCFQIQDWG